MKLRSQSGFSIIEVGIVIAVIGIIGLLGYTFYTNQVNKTNNTDQQTSQTETTSDVKTAPQITSAADLDAAETALDQTDPSADTSQLDAEVANF